MSLQQLYLALLIGGFVLLASIVGTRVATRVGFPSLLLFLLVGVLLGCVAVDGRSPGGKRREHGISVGDRLVPGDTNPSPNAGGRAHQGFAEHGHPANISCGSRWFRELVAP